MSQARRRASEPAPEPAAVPGDGVKRPGQLLPIALVVCGLWPQLWLAAVGLIPIAFFLTWSGAWEKRHSLMAAGTLLWVSASAAQFAADANRAGLGLGWWAPPGWLTAIGAQYPIPVLLAQAAGIGLVAWAADGMRSLLASQR